MSALYVGRERPRPLVLCFMAGLSGAARVSGQCYYEALVVLIMTQKDAR